MISESMAHKGNNIHMLSFAVGRIWLSIFTATPFGSVERVTEKRPLVSMMMWFTRNKIIMVPLAYMFLTFVMPDLCHTRTHTHSLSSKKCAAYMHVSRYNKPPVEA